MTRNWIHMRRQIVVAPVKKQVWHFIWNTAMNKITPDKKSYVDSNGEFKLEYKSWNYDYDDFGNRYKCKTYTIHKYTLNTMGHVRGRQIALGRALGYNKKPLRNFGHSDPGMGPYNGWHNGCKPRGKKADKLLDIAGFEDFTHAMFIWAGAGKRISPIFYKKPIKRLYTKDLIKLAETNIDNHLGDCCDGDSTPLEIYNNACTLALDALCDADCDEYRAHGIATQVCKGYEQEKFYDTL